MNRYLCRTFVLLIIIFSLVFYVGASDSSDNSAQKQENTAEKENAKREYGSISCGKGFLARTFVALPADKIYTDKKTLDFIWAIQHNDLESMKKLYQTGIDINSAGLYGFTPICFALGSNEECFRWLLEKGANPDILCKTSDDFSWSLLSLSLDLDNAFELEYPPVKKRLVHFRLLLEYGANPNFKSRQQLPVNWDFRPPVCIYTMKTCLRSIKYSSDLEPIKLLIKSGVNLNPPEVDYLFVPYSQEAILLLLENGADENRKFIVEERRFEERQGKVVFKDSYIVSVA